MKKKITTALIFLMSVIAEFFITKGLDKISEIITYKKIDNKVLSFLFQKNQSLATVIFSCILVCIITIIIISLLKKNRKPPLEKIKKKFLKDCPKSIEIENNIFAEYKVDFSYMDGLPIPRNVIIKCIKDDVPTYTVLDDNHCCISASACNKNCVFKNYFLHEQKETLKKHIRSYLISLWENRVNS